MSVEFEKIRWKNFLSTGSDWTEIGLKSHTTTLIIGDNGAGKSTFLDALLFLLFKKPFRKINLPQLVNSISKKDLVVEGEFTIGKKQYKIIRGIAPTIFEVYCNGVMINQSADSKDYQHILETEILRSNYKSFCQIVVLGSACFVPFMSLKASDRREVVEDLLDLQIFTSMNEILTEKLKVSKKNIADSESQIKNLRDKVSLMKKHVAELTQNNDELIADKLEKIAQAKESIEKAETAISNLNDDIVTLMEEFEAKSAIKKKIKKFEAYKLEMETEKKNIAKEVSFFDKHDTCPTCTQPIDHEFKCSFVDQKSSRVSELQEGIDMVLGELKKYDVALEELEALNKKSQKKNNELHSEKSILRVNEAALRGLQSEYKALLNKKTAIDTDKLDEHERQLVDMEKAFNILHEDREIMMASSALLKDGGIKSLIIKQYIPIMNKYINHYLASMEFFVDFNMNEQFVESIHSRFRDAYTYESFSEGEKARINVAILFAWRAIAKHRNSINTNILIFDEIMDSSLDNNGEGEFIKIISKLTDDTNTFIISHKVDALSEKFGRVLRFNKSQNYSKMSVI